MNSVLNQQIRSVLDDLMKETNGDTGIYLDMGVMRVRHASLHRILPLIKAKVQMIDHGLAVTAITAPDAHGLCLINFDKVR